MWISISAIALAILLLAGYLALRFYRRYAPSVISMGRIFRNHLDETTTGIKMLVFYNKPAVKDHLAALNGPTSGTSDHIAISYGLSRVVERITPTFFGAENSGTVVCTVAIGAAFRKRVAPCLDSHKKFATEKNIALCTLEEPPPYLGRPVPWMKIPLIAKLLHAGYKRVLFIDADAMVTNVNFRMEDIFEKLENSNRPVLVTEDEDGINTGVMFVQNIPAATRLLDLIWLNDSDLDNGTWEQNALKVLMDSSNEIRSLVAIEDRPKRINSFPIERRLFHPTRAQQVWSLGDFICHFSGLRTPHLERYISDYASSLQKNSAELSALAQRLAAPQD